MFYVFYLVRRWQIDARSVSLKQGSGFTLNIDPSGERNRCFYQCLNFFKSGIPRNQEKGFRNLLDGSHGSHGSLVWLAWLAGSHCIQTHRKTKFAFTIKADVILSVLYSFNGKQWWNKRSSCIKKQSSWVNERFRRNQMIHSCKFYSILRDQSLEKWVKYIKDIDN